MKRAIVSTDAVGGVWVYSLELARALKPAVQVELAVLGPPPAAAQLQQARQAETPVHVLNLPMDWTAASAGALAQASQAIRALSRRRQADFLQLHSPALVGTGDGPPVLAVLHSCVGTWWRAMHGLEPPPEDFRWRMQQVREGLQAADIVIAPSQALADAAREVYDIERPIDIVHNARSAAPAPSGTRSGVLAAGRLWDEAKNIQLLDRAAGRLGPAIPIRAAGPVTGPNGTHIDLRFAIALGDLPQEKLAAAMAEARLFAAPARYEPFGLAVLEAAQAGLPLILADIPTFRELWDNAACFLPPHNPEIWARVLNALHRCPGECEAMGRRARRRARRYAPERFAENMRRIYDRLEHVPHARAA